MSRKLHSVLRYINGQKAMLLCLGLFLLWNPKKVDGQSFVHPGLPHTLSDLNQLKNDITREPWLSAYNAFKNDRRSKLSYVPSTPQPTVSRAPNLNNEPWKSDMVAVHNLAWMWWFTRDTAYARKATDILDAWAVTNTSWGGQEANLDIGDYAQFWGGGAEILRYTYPGWTQANTSHVENYFMNVLFPSSAVPFPLSDQNKGALQLKTAFAASVFCNDRTRFNQTVAVYRMDAGGGMRNSLPNGEVGDTGRDDHWRVQAAALAWGAEVAYKQRVDMFSELDNRVLAIGELYHKYAFDGANMTYVPFGGYASFWTNWGILPGARTGDMTNLIYSAYTVRKGIPTPATDRMRASLGGAGGDFLYLKSTDTATAAKLTPVYYPSEHVSPVTNLTTVDIGNPGIAGSTSVNNGNWTVKGAGNSTNNAFSFNFKKVSGDAGLVVKINSISLSTGGFGVMMRESLATGTNFYTLLLNSSGGAGRHYQPKAPWWLKIERVGLRIFTYHSFDGINWTNLGCFYNPNGFPQDLYAGFYSLSNNTSVLNTVNISNVGFSQNSPQGSPEISSATTVSAVLGSPFSYNITATGSPNMFGAANLPAGLSINTTTGLISGNPTETGEREVGLTASNAGGTGTATLIFKVFANQVPPAPQSPAANTVNTSQIRISWAAVAGATSYNIKRSSVPGGPYTILQSGILTNSFVDISPVPEDKNYYVISAFIGTKESPNSNEVTSSVPPVIPLTPVAISKTDRISLTWQPVERVNSYKVKRATVSGGPYTTLSTVNTTSFDDLAVINGKPYYYVLSSVGVSQESGNSGEAFGSPGSSSYVWNPTPASDSLNLSRNWLENMVPVSPAIITFNNSTDTLLNNDISGIATSRIQFGSYANAFSISGNRLTVKNDLINNSLRTQSFLTPLTLADTLNVASLNGEISLRGQISGSGALVKSGTSKLSIIGSDNNYTGNTIIKSGILAAAGIGTGTPGSPTTGPLGLGKIMMSGGALQATAGADLNLYNNIEVLPGRSFMYEDVNSITLWGKLLGKGTLEHDGNDYAGLNLWGDNTEFEGTFISKLRSGKQRIRFNTPLAGSEKANWLLDANGIDCQGINFANGTIHFGALNGRGYFRVNAKGNQVLSVGALNTYSSYGGTINSNGSNLSVVKVGTGVLEMWGNQAYSGNTTVKGGKLLINNNAISGVFPGPIVIEEGALGGFGVTQSSATIGTGSGAGSVLEPGFLKLGTLKVGSLIMNADATYQAEINLADTTSDQLSANQITLNNPTLSLSIASGSSVGSVYKIIDNTGSNLIIGTFKGLSEGATIEVKGYTFSVTYLGGDGNDVQLKLLSINTAVTSRHAFYKFEESGGALAVDSWGNNSATLQAGAKRGTGREGSALLLDGAATSYASLPAGIVSNLNDFTISTWIKMDAKTTWMRVFDFGAGTSKYMFFSIQVGTANNMRYAIKNGGAEQQLNFTYNLPLNTWVHFTITQSQNVSSVYINGQFVASNPSISIKPSTLGSTNLNYLGKSQFNDPMFRGAIDEFKIYNRALSATEVANTYNPQAITETTNTQKTMGDDDFDPLSSSSGLPVSYVSSNESIASIVNGKVHLIAPGTVVLTASQAGNENFWPAANISHTLIIKKSQLITFPAIAAKTFGDDEFDPGARSSSMLDVTYVSSDSTIALVRNGKIKILRSGTVNLTATQAGNQIFGAAKPIAQELTIVKQNQTIVFPAIANKTFGDADFVLAATASSGLAVSYLSSDHSIATIENGKVHLLGAGVVTITASQDGNENISAAASVIQQLNVEKKLQNITFAAMEMKHFGMPSFIPNVTSSSNLAVILTSSDESLAKIINGSIHLLGAGQVTITASQPGDQYFSAATPISQIINIGKNSQEINFSSIGTKTFGSADFALSASASSGLSVTYTSSDPLIARIIANKIQIVGAGVATITASQDGNGNYNPALPVSQSLTVIKQSQTINFAPITTKTFGDSDFDPLAASSAALPVSYTSSDESVAVILNGKVHIVGAGTATITADQIGDVNTAPAAPASQLLSVSRKMQAITLPAIGVKLLGEDDFNPGAQQSSGLAVTYTSSNTSVAEIVNGKVQLRGTGSSLIRARVEGNKNLNPAESESQEVTVIITKDVNITGKRGQFFSYQISHQASLDRFSASGLPLGLKLNTKTGTISGIPLVAGSFVVKLTASNETSSGSQNITLVIADFSFDILAPLKNIRIYPNPVPGNQFSIATGIDLAGKQVEVKLVDLMGRVVYLAVLKNDAGMIKVVLNKSLPSGLYVVILDRRLAGKVLMK